MNIPPRAARRCVNMACPRGGAPTEFYTSVNSFDVECAECVELRELADVRALERMRAQLGDDLNHLSIGMEVASAGRDRPHHGKCADSAAAASLRDSYD